MMSAMDAQQPIRRSGSSRSPRARVLRRILSLGLVLLGVAWLYEAVNRDTQMIVTVGPSPFDVAVDMANGRAFVLTTRPDTASTADLNIIDTATGSLLRTVSAGPMPTTLTVDDRVGRVFVATGAHTVRILDAQDGRVRTTISVPGMSATSISLLAAPHDHHVFVIGDTSVTMLDSISGQVGRVIPLGLFVSGATVDTRRDRIYITGYDGTSNVGTVRILDAANGHVLRTTVLDGSPSPGPVAVDERDGRVFVLDRSIDGYSMLDASGRVLRTVNLGASFYPEAVAVDEHTHRVFVTISDASGTGGVRTVAVGGRPSALVVDVHAGRVYVITAKASAGTGSASELDAASGALVHTLPLDMSPSAAVGDNRSGLVIVIGTAEGRPRRTMDVWGWVPRWLQHWLPFFSPVKVQGYTMPGRVGIIRATP